MEHDDDRIDPQQNSSNLPSASRHFTTRELEAVIRRAVELQAGSTARADEGVSDVEIVRIGKELGLEPATIRRAMAEVRTRTADEGGALVTLAGPRTVRASRVLRRPAASTGLLLDRHLREKEFMVPQRRFPDRTRYVRDSSLAAGLARFARGLSRSHRPLDLKQLDVAVSVIDADTCLLELGVDLAGTRGGLVAGVLGSSGGLAAGWAATAWATAIADPLMLLGVPLVAGAWVGTRAIYNAIRTSVQDRLESLLDRVEHNDL